jgi:hypothetical protein
MPFLSLTPNRFIGGTEKRRRKEKKKRFYTLHREIVNC